MKKLYNRINECINLIKSGYPNILKSPEKNNILLTYEYMNYNILGFTTFEPNAKHIKYIISLNKNYINSNKYFYISEIIPHEMAHIICFENKLINVSLHNNDWKNLCIIMGGSGQKILNFNGEEKCYMR